MTHQINWMVDTLVTFNQSHQDELLKCYLILNPNAPSNPIQSYFKQEAWRGNSSQTIEARPLWNGTIYQDWLAFSPYMAQTPLNHSFIKWLSEQSDDWGFIALSSYDFKTVYHHIQSLTQVWLSDGSYTFFKFWETQYGFELFRLLSPSVRFKALGPCRLFINNERTIKGTFQEEITLRSFPWLEIDEWMTNFFFYHDPSIFETNMFSLIQAEHPELIERYHEPVIKARLRAYHKNFIKKQHGIDINHSHLFKYLNS